jgi:hypothetical protein
MSDEEVAERAKEWPEKFCSLDVNGTRKDIHAALGRPTAFFRTQIEKDDKDMPAHYDIYEYYEDNSEPPDRWILTIHYYEDDRVQAMLANVLLPESLADFPCEPQRYRE